MDLFVLIVNVKVNYSHQHLVELKRCVKTSIVFIYFYQGPLLCKIPLDPKMQALIDQGKSIFEELK